MAIMGILALAAAWAGTAWSADESKADVLSAGGAALRFDPDRGTVDLVAEDTGSALSRLRISRNGVRADRISGQTKLETDGEWMRRSATFVAGNEEFDVEFALNERGEARLQTADDDVAIEFLGPFDYGVVPSRHVEDLVYDPAQYKAGETLYSPNENLAMGMMEQGDAMLVVAWPDGDQEARWHVEPGESPITIRSLEFVPFAARCHFAVFRQEDLWQKIEFTSEYLEREVELEWEPPFEAVWKIQVLEFGDLASAPVETKPRRKTFWRPEHGRFPYPFTHMPGEKVKLTIGKKLWGADYTLLYALEGHEMTPYAFLMRSLSPEEQLRIIDTHGVASTFGLNRPDASVAFGLACKSRDHSKAAMLPNGYWGGGFLETHAIDRSEFVGKSVQLRNMHYSNFVAEWTDRLLLWESDANSPEEKDLWATMLDVLATMERLHSATLYEHTPHQWMGHVESWRDTMIRLAAEQEDRERSLEAAPEIFECIQQLNAVVSQGETVSVRSGREARNMFNISGRRVAQMPEAMDRVEELREALKILMLSRDRESFVKPKSLLSEEHNRNLAREHGLTEWIDELGEKPTLTPRNRSEDQMHMVGAEYME